MNGGHLFGWTKDITLWSLVFDYEWRHQEREAGNILTVPLSNVTFNLFTFFALLKNTSFLCGIKSLTNL
jgi:hypothetical protein